MAENTKIDLTRAFAFAFEDSAWPKKFLFGGAAVLLAPALVGALALLGYGRVVFRASREGRDELPDWDRVGDYMADGVQAFVVVFAYTLPLWAAAVGASVVSLAASALSEDVPRWLGWCCSAPFAFIITLFVLFTLPAALARHYETGSLAAAFEFQPIVDFLRANLRDYLPVFGAAVMSSAVTVTLVSVGMPLVVVLVGLPVLAGGLFLGFLSWVAHLHAMGQLRRVPPPSPEAGEDAPTPDNLADLPEA